MQSNFTARNWTEVFPIERRKRLSQRSKSAAEFVVASACLELSIIGWIWAENGGLDPPELGFGACRLCDPAADHRTMPRTASISGLVSQCLEELELIATVETSDDVDRRSLCDQLANDVAQQRGYRHRDRPDTPHLIGRAHSRATAIPHSAGAARK